MQRIHPNFIQIILRITAMIDCQVPMSEARLFAHHHHSLSIDSAFFQKQSTYYSVTRKSSTVKPRVDASQTDSGQEIMPRRCLQ